MQCTTRQGTTWHGRAQADTHAHVQMNWARRKISAFYNYSIRHASATAVLYCAVLLLAATAVPTEGRQLRFLTSGGSSSRGGGGGCEGARAWNNVDAARCIPMIFSSFSWTEFVTPVALPYPCPALYCTELGCAMQRKLCWCCSNMN